jgi:peptidoglycan/xylan/chitin deacetylase (PgdA/CDA1 family)
MSCGNQPMIQQVKIYLKYLFAIGFCYSGACRFLLSRKMRLKRNWPLVLMYHRVVKENETEGLQPGIFVTADTFDRQVGFITGHFKLIAMSDFIGSLPNDNSYCGKDIILTFDDGWRDNYLNAFPIIKKHNIPVTIYLTSDFIGTSYLFWFQEISSILSRDKSQNKKLAETITTVLNKYFLSEAAKILLNENIESLLDDPDRFIEMMKILDSAVIFEITSEMKKISGGQPIQNNDERQLLNWGEISKMNRAGADFGSHGLTHRLLDSLDTDEVDKELVESKKAIESKLGKPVGSLTYPNGNYNDKIEKQVEKAGYACAFIVGKNARKDKYAIGRVGVHNGVSIAPNGKYSPAMFAWHLYRNM